MAVIFFFGGGPIFREHHNITRKFRWERKGKGMIQDLDYFSTNYNGKFTVDTSQ